MGVLQHKKHTFRKYFIMNKNIYFCQISWFPSGNPGCETIGFQFGNSEMVLFRVELGLSRSLSYGFMARWRQQENRLNPAGCLIRAKGGDRLREAPGKFQPRLCRKFSDGI